MLTFHNSVFWPIDHDTYWSTFLLCSVGTTDIRDEISSWGLHRGEMEGGGWIVITKTTCHCALLDNLIRTLDKHHRSSSHCKNKPVERMKTQSRRKKAMTGPASKQTIKLMQLSHLIQLMANGQNNRHIFTKQILKICFKNFLNTTKVWILPHNIYFNWHDFY